MYKEIIATLDISIQRVMSINCTSITSGLRTIFLNRQSKLLTHILSKLMEYLSLQFWILKPVE